jgi:hypothetical protein
MQLQAAVGNRRPADEIVQPVHLRYKHVERTAKDVKKRYVWKHLQQYYMYLRTLRSQTNTRATFRQFCSRAHKIETVDYCKVAWCAYDDKRYVLQDGVSTQAYGHVTLLNKLIKYAVCRSSSWTRESNTRLCAWWLGVHLPARPSPSFG